MHWDSETDENRRFPLNLFSIPFGLAGLAGTWTSAVAAPGVSVVVADVLWLVAALAWLIALARYLVAARTPRRVPADLAHPVLGPFGSLVPTTGMLLGASLSRYAPEAGRVVVVAMAVLGALVATQFVAGLLGRARSIDQLHSGYLLPTVAAGLIGGQSLAAVGLHAAGVASFAVGLLMWVLVGAPILARLAFRPSLPNALLPTVAIFAAPPAVAGNALFVLAGPGTGLAQQALLGTFVLFVAAQLPMIAVYARLPFALGFWALTFTTAASGSYALHWLAATASPVATTGAVAVLAITTAVIGWVAVRSIVFALRPATSDRPALDDPAGRP